MAINFPSLNSAESEVKRKEILQANAALYKAIKTAGLADLGVLTTIPEVTDEMRSEKKPPSVGARLFARLRPREKTGLNQINPFGNADEELPKFTHKLEFEHCYLHIGIDVNLGFPDRGDDFGPTSHVQFVFEAKPAELAEEMYLGSAKLDVTSRPTGVQLTNIEVRFKDKNDVGVYQYAPTTNAESVFIPASEAIRIMRHEAGTLYGAVPLSTSIKTTLNNIVDTPTVKAKKIAGALLLGHNLGHEMLRKEAIPSERFIAGLKRSAGIEPEIDRKMANRMITEVMDNNITERANAQHEKEVQYEIGLITIELKEGGSREVDLSNSTQYEWIRYEAVNRLEAAREERRKKAPSQPVGEEAVRINLIRKEFVFDLSIDRVVGLLDRFGWLPLADLFVSFDSQWAVHNLTIGRTTEGKGETDRERLFNELSQSGPRAYTDYIINARSTKPAKYREFLGYYATVRVPDDRGGISLLPPEVVKGTTNKSILPRSPIIQGIGSSITHNGVTLSVVASVNKERGEKSNTVVEAPSFFADTRELQTNLLQSSETITCGLMPGADIPINQVSYTQVFDSDGDSRSVTLAHRGKSELDSVECRIYIKGGVRLIEFWQVPKIYVLDEANSKPDAPTYKLRTEALMPCLPEEVDETLRKEMLQFAIQMLKTPKEELIEFLADDEIRTRIGSSDKAAFEAFSKEERTEIERVYCEEIVFEQVEVFAKKFMQNFYQVTKTVNRRFS